MSRMRTVTEAHKELVENDPGTAFTLRALKRLVAEGKIPYISIGRKRLINMEQLEKYLSQSTAT